MHRVKKSITLEEGDYLFIDSHDVLHVIKPHELEELVQSRRREDTRVFKGRTPAVRRSDEQRASDRAYVLECLRKVGEATPAELYEVMDPGISEKTELVGDLRCLYREGKVDRRLADGQEKLLRKKWLYRVKEL